MSEQRNKTATLKVPYSYEDDDKNLYQGEALVEINKEYEIQHIELQGITAYNENDEIIEPAMSLTLISQIESIAGTKAIEQAQEIDFIKDCERD